jgi:heat-inducible transcriptional repressor
MALLVAVLSDGAVEKRSLELGEDVDEDVVATASQCLAAHVRTHGAASGTTAVAPRGEARLDRLLAAAADALSTMEGQGRSGDQVFVGGSSKVAGAFDAVETVRSVLAILEQQLVVVTLLRDVLNRGLSVAIGAEHGYQALASCAVVVAPLSADGLEAGAVGLLGPTRMDYSRALAAAHVVGERLGERIGVAAPPPARSPWQARRATKGS